MRARWYSVFVVAALVFAVVVSVGSDQPANARATPDRVVLVVGDPDLAPADAAVVARLEAALYAVTVVDDGAVTAADAEGTGAVLISTTVSGWKVGDTFRDVAAPVVVWKPWLYDDMGMTGPIAHTDYGVEEYRSSVDITDPNHPLAGGLAGTVTLTTAPASFPWGQPAADADVVATVGGKPTLFAYAAGDRLADGDTATGCRFAIAAYHNAITLYDPAGWHLFEVAVAEATRCGAAAPTGILFVTDTAAADRGDAAVVTHLEAAGYTVTEVDDGLVTPDMLAGRTAVLVSSTVAARADLGNALRNTTTPVVIWKPWLYDDLGMTGPTARTDYGVKGNRTSIDMADIIHPLHGGLWGAVTLTTASARIPWGQPGPAADVVASVAGKPTLFAYEVDDHLAVGGSAAGCRIGVPAYRGTVNLYTADGWHLFDTAVAFAVSGCNVPLPTGYAAVDTGSRYTCGDGWGDFVCWGSGLHGKLGYGGEADRVFPTRVNRRSSFYGGVFSTGHGHACAVTGGEVWCWGDNREGQLGIGTTDPILSTVPSRVSKPAGFENVTAITAGFSHTCALTDAAEVWCWGENSEGGLGDGTNTSSSVPVRVTAPAGFADIVQVSAGSRYTCAVTRSGDPWCWGESTGGKLGVGDERRRLVPTPVVRPSGFEIVASITTGSDHTCALTVGGIPWCWGGNWFGQSGLGHAVDRSSVPMLVEQSTGLDGATALSAGSDHTCAVTGHGEVWCWGLNTDGQVGDGTTEQRPVPVLVDTTAPFDFTDIETVAAGSSHTCAVSTFGAAWCWGENAAGALGDGSTTPSLVPVPVATTRAPA